jgi:hypothetical protein
MPVKEEVVVFGKSVSAIGIITDPSEVQVQPDLPAFLLLNAGTVPHFGPHRVHVKVARALANMGFVVMRFDFSGSGDSGIRMDTLPFAKSSIIETQEAMDHLSICRGVKRFVLLGICSGGGVSLRTAAVDPRVVGVVCANPTFVRKRNALFQVQSLIRYYVRIALFSSYSIRTWKKIITGSLDLTRLLAAAKAPLSELFEDKNRDEKTGGISGELFRELIDRGVAIVLAHSEGERSLDDIHMTFGRELRRWSSDGRLKYFVIRGANHTFSLLENQEDFLVEVQKWAKAFQTQQAEIIVR